MPPPSYVEHAKRRDTFFTVCGDPQYWRLLEPDDGSISYEAEKSSKTGRRRGPPGSRTLEECLPNHVRCLRPSANLFSALFQQDPQLFNFLCRCLRWLPSERMTPSQAVNHPWIHDALRPPDEHNAESDSSPLSSPRSIRQSGVSALAKSE